MNEKVHRPAWAEVDLTAIADNLRELRRITEPGAGLMAVVKANAYGHGAVPVSRVALANGADWLGVAILDEARELRAAGITAPILMLGFTPAEQAEEVVNLGLAQTVYTLEAAEALSAAAQKTGREARIHLKIDTGMGRLGFSSDSGTVMELAQLAALPGLKIEGIFTHFAVADTSDKEYTRHQYEQFHNLLRGLKSVFPGRMLRHAANSAALIDLPDLHLDMVRAGVSVYGLAPSKEVEVGKLKLRPALSLKAKVAFVKTVSSGTSISYGRTYITDRETIVAVVPAGYADGYSRLLSNKSQVLIHGHRVPVIGTICMDQFMVDISKVPDVKIGDEVVLLGSQGAEQVTADELADLMGTINYEIVCMISDRVPRIYI